MRFLPGLVFLFLLTPNGPAQAQMFGYGYGGGSNNNDYHHASTAEEGYARGMADIVRSTGLANLYNSEAAKNLSVAREQEIRNRKAFVETYQEERLRYKEYRRAMDGPRPTSEQLFRMAKQRVPKPLANSQLDPLTGDIQWPTVLQLEQYDEGREAIQELYSKWAFGVMDPNEKLIITRNVQIMQDQLKDHIRDYPTSDYLAARRFLLSLAQSSRFPAG